jgi:hypothetical protein
MCWRADAQRVASDYAHRPASLLARVDEVIE